MSTLPAAPSDQGTVRADEDFWDLVCADDEWLRAEFDAIIAAGFPEKGRRPRLPRRPGQRPRSVRPAAGSLHASTPGRATRGRTFPRERSPPWRGRDT